MNASEKQWRPVEHPAAKPGEYFPGQQIATDWWVDDAAILPIEATASKPPWKLPAWMTVDWPQDEPESDANHPLWATIAVLVLAAVLLLATLQPWTWW